MKKILLGLVGLFLLHMTVAQDNQWKGKFEQLGTNLPTPNEYRTGSGAPGNAYWQQKADYDMEIEIDDENQRLSGKESITYFNNSPDALKFVNVRPTH